MSEKIPSIELLNSTHTFPCHYTIKAIGKNQPTFSEQITSALKPHVAEPGHVTLSQRTSGDDKHLSVTLEIWVFSAEQVQGIYRALLKIDGLMMLL